MWTLHEDYNVTIPSYLRVVYIFLVRIQSRLFGHTAKPSHVEFALVRERTNVRTLRSAKDTTVDQHSLVRPL